MACKQGLARQGHSSILANEEIMPFAHASTWRSDELGKHPKKIESRSPGDPDKQISVKQAPWQFIQIDSAA